MFKPKYKQITYKDYGWNSDTEYNFFKHWNIQNKLANFDSTQTNL